MSKSSAYAKKWKCSCGRRLAGQGVPMHLRSNPTHKVAGWKGKKTVAATKRGRALRTEVVEAKKITSLKSKTTLVFCPHCGLHLEPIRIALSMDGLLK